MVIPCGRTTTRSSSTMLLMAVSLVINLIPVISSGVIGVNYGLVANNLPAPTDVINLYVKCGINIVRIFEPNQDVLNALRGKNLLLVLGTRNEDVSNFASNQEAANDWVNTNVVPYYNDVNIAYITIGNEIVPGDLASSVANAINNIKQALVIAGVKNDILVTTVVPMNALAVSYPPSAGAFSEDAIGPMRDIIQAVGPTGTILINAYPYFAYASNPEQISLDYSLFLSNAPVVVDGNLNYYNLYDAMIDSFYAALEKIDAPNVRVEVSETGWPTAGNEPYTSTQNALTYNKYLVEHVSSGKGTPRRPNVIYNAMIFAMFNENLKQPGVEQNFGLFYPDMTPVYPFLSC